MATCKNTHRKPVTDAETLAKQANELKWDYHTWWIIFAMFFMVSASIIIFLLRPGTLESRIANADTPSLLLEGYAVWYQMFKSFYTLIVPFVPVFGLLALVFYLITARSPVYESAKMKIRILGIPLTEPVLVILMEIFFSFVLISLFLDVQPYKQYKDLMADVAVQEGRLESTQVYMNDNYEKAGFAACRPDAPKPVTAYSVINAVRDDNRPNTWYRVYVPDCLDFTLDTEHLFNENKSVDWNSEHTTVYLITYTPNYHLVTSIEVYRDT